MAALDPKKTKANIALIKTALRKAAVKQKDGEPVRVGFAFAPGKDKNDHLLLIDPRKRAQALLQQIVKEHKDRKTLCSGTATVTKDGGKFTLGIKYIKKLPGAERKMQEALKAMSLNQYKVVLEKVKDDEEVEDVKERAPEEDEELENARAADDDEEAAEDEDTEASDADGEEEDEDEKEDAEASDDEDEEDEDEEDEEEEEEEPAAAASSSAPPAAKLAALGQAPQVWHQTRGVMSKSIDKLKAAIKQEYASEAPELNAEIEKSMAQMDRIMQRLDHRLAEQLDKAHKAKDEASRKAELAKAKVLLADHIKYIQTEPLIGHIDANPFGVDTNLKKVLTASLTHMAKVVS